MSHLRQGSSRDLEKPFKQPSASREDREEPSTGLLAGDNETLYEKYSVQTTRSYHIAQGTIPNIL